MLGNLSEGDQGDADANGGPTTDRVQPYLDGVGRVMPRGGHHLRGNDAVRPNLPRHLPPPPFELCAVVDDHWLWRAGNFGTEWDLL